MADTLDDADGCASDVPCKDTRGWAMRQGHCKRLRRESGRESARGRAVFSRSVNRSTRFKSWDAIGARTSLRSLRYDLRDSIEFDYFDGVATSRWEEDESTVDIEFGWDCGGEDVAVRTTCSSFSQLRLPDIDADVCSTTTASSYESSCCGDSPSTLLRGQPFLVRTCSDPSTKLEYAQAASRASRSYVPLRAWARSSLLTARLVEVPSREPSRWELAVARAEQGAIQYIRAGSAPRAAKKKHVRTTPCYSDVQRKFDALRTLFMEEHRDLLRTKLSSCFGCGGAVAFSRTAMSSNAVDKFMTAHRELGQIARIRPVYHGTRVDNYASIFERGLLIPGEGNDLRVVHGSAHGLGIYTATATNPSLSRSYAGASQLLVCGYLEVDGVDDSTVRYVGDAIVIFDSRRVIPLFVAKGREQPVPSPVNPLPARSYPVRSRGSPKHTRTSQTTQHTTVGLVAHYARRAAQKRRR